MKALTIVLAGLLPAAAPLQSGASAPPSFCTRMAEQLGLNPAKPVNGKAAYEARALKGLGTALFGGSATVTMMLKPPVTGDIGDPARYATACNAVGGALSCQVSGPAIFDISVKDRTASVEARAGEMAEVRMAKNRVRCQDR